MPNDISKLCDFNVDLGLENNMFNMLGRNDENFGSLRYFSGYDAALDPHWIYLEDKPRKIMWSTFFYFSFDFSMAFGLLKRALNFFVTVLLMLSQPHACEPYAAVFDKLQRALMASSLNSGVLKK